jgi:hypothetical protein
MPTTSLLTGQGNDVNRQNPQLKAGSWDLFGACSQFAITSMILNWRLRLIHIQNHRREL